MRQSGHPYSIQGFRHSDEGLLFLSIEDQKHRIEYPIRQDCAKDFMCYELGHALLHGELAAMRGFQELEMFDITSRTEYEANLFAAELLIGDEVFLELLNDSEKSFFGVAKELYVPAELLDFKFRILKNKGYHLEAPYIVQADFLKGNIPGCFD